MSFEKVIQILQKQDSVVMRFAPSPNGMPTLGHLKGLVILDYLKQQMTKNNKTCVLNFRFDDTNPSEGYKPEYYKAFTDLIHQYSIRVDNIYYSSDESNRINYVRAVTKLLELKRAFICNCNRNVTTYHTRNCDCISNEALQERSVSDLINQVVKFIPTDRTQMNYVIYRKTENTYCPTFALQGAVDDYNQNTTVIIRGRDLESVTNRQKDLYELLYNKTYPEVIYWGRISLWNSRTKQEWNISKSELKDSKDFPSLQAFRSLGYTSSAIRDWILSYNITKNDIKWDMLKLDSFQRRLYAV
jgi:glutamyl-tRNA synthetase